MNSLNANTRNTKSKGDVRSLRLAGDIPGIIYGGPEQNQKVTVLKKTSKVKILFVLHQMLVELKEREHLVKF